jgi:hypothetical protein
MRDAMPSNDDEMYLFASFREPNGLDGLHLAYSRDGYRWTDLGGGFIKPRVGVEKLMRDTCMARGPHDTFHLIWTAGWSERGFGHATSKDLVHWSEQQYIEIMAHEPTCRNVWAPKLRFDVARSEFMIYWSSTIPGRYPGDELHPDRRNHRLFYTLTRDFASFARPTVLFDPGHSVIDAILIDRPDGGVAMVFKDERLDRRQLRVACGASATGPFADISEPISPPYTEGPTALRLDDRWLVYYDSYRAGCYGAVESPDLRNWTDVSSRIACPSGQKHGTIFTAPANLVEKL